MRKLVSSLLVVALVAAACVGGAAQTQMLTQNEREVALSHLHATQKAFLDSIQDLSEAQWKFKPGPDRWSVAEVAEHIALGEDVLYEFVTKKVLESPATPEKKGQSKEHDEWVLNTIPDRSNREQTSGPLLPTGKWASREDLVRHFKASRERTADLVNAPPKDLRAHFIKHPAGKDLDAYQWVLVIAVHTRHHVEQINEVKADPKFPR